jgi:type I restriction enzyme S subunit
LLSLTGNVGRICTVIGHNYLLNQRVAKIKSNYPCYAYCLFKSDKMFHDMNNLANGAAQQNLSPIRTGQLKIVKPSDDILGKFEQVTKTLFEKKIVLNNAIITARQARDRLLPKLMNGEIEV